MTQYSFWNTAIIEHTTHGAPLGSTIFLDITDEALEKIGRQRWGDPPGESWRANFIDAVRAAGVFGGHLHLPNLGGQDPQGRPAGVAFLAATVLAAMQMAGEGDVHETNYFRRLCELLRVDPDPVRPRGMATGAEEALWNQWTAWLRSRGYLSTAASGQGARRYTSYPISQALVRRADRQRLARVFQDHPHWSAEWDAETLLANLRRERDLTAHLKQLFTRTGRELEDVQYAVFEAFQDWQASRDSGQAWHGRSRPLFAGLYRKTHWRTGEGEYALYPRQPRGVRFSDLSVRLGGAEVPLSVQRPGWFNAVGFVTADQLTEGAQFDLRGTHLLDALVLPRREFWILPADPDDSGQHASTHTPQVGEQFVLVCRAEHLGDLERYRAADLLQWSGDPEELEPGSDWYEVMNCQVTANHWQEVASGKSRALYDALRPSPAGSVNASLSGGLRIPGSGGWLVGCGPAVTVHTFFTDAHLRVLHGSSVVFDAEVEPNTPVTVPWMSPGDYTVEATSRGQQYVRLAKIVQWDELKPASHLGAEAVRIGEWQISGPRASALTPS